MSMPRDIGAIDLMLNIPGEDNRHWYEFMKPLFLDEESQRTFEMPAQYMFKDLPKTAKQDDYIAYTVGEMDRHGIERAMLGVDDDNAVTREALERYPSRFFGSYHANPNRGMSEVRKIERLHRERGIKAVTAFPCGLCPQVPIDDKRWYPIYAKCVELDIPIACCVGVPGPRLPMAPQRVELIDEVCWFFPELTVVMRHGGLPWVDSCVQMLLRWPNLYYATTAVAPKYWPGEIVQLIRKRAPDKVIFAGYWPLLSYERVFAELAALDIDDSVLPQLLSGNAVRAFKLEEVV